MARRRKHIQSKRFVTQEIASRNVYRVQDDAEKLLAQHKRMVEDWSIYFRANNARYWEFMNFICASTMSDSEVAALLYLEKPAIEFNLLEAMVSRLRAEFSKQEPSFNVRAADGVPLEMLTPTFIATEQVVEGFLRAIFNDATNDGLQSNIYTDQLIGGFSAMYIHTEYVNENSFEQNIVVDRVFDPTMTFFDPMARTSHKGDGQYCGMLIPYTKERFIDEFGAEAAKNIRFQSSSRVGGFSWSYESQDQKIVLVAYMYKKHYRKVKKYKLTTGEVMTADDYQEMLDNWTAIEQAPAILDKRTVNEESIVIHQFCESKELYSAETDFKFLPIIFVDGNSVLVNGQPGSGSTRTGGAGLTAAISQMTRPYPYQAKGAQKAKNFAGQSQMAAIENLNQAQLKVPLEGIPLDQIEAYQNPQKANVLIYNQFGKNGERLDPPMEMMKQQIPSIIESTFMMMDQTIQATLGSYDAQQGVVGDQMSGKAIMQGVLQSDGASGCYSMNNIKAWNRAGEIVIDLIPKYYKTPRSIPVIGKDGKRSFQIINQPGEEESVSMTYEPHSFQIKVEAGVNSEVQKQISMDMINRSMQANQWFADFMGKKGLEVYVENLNIRNSDTLKMLAAEYMQEQAQAAQQAMEAQANQPTEMEVVQQVEMAKVEQRAAEAEGKLAVSAAELSIKQEEAELEKAKFIVETQEKEQKLSLEAQKVAAENARSAIEALSSIVKESIDD